VVNKYAQKLTRLFSNLVYLLQIDANRCYKSSVFLNLFIRIMAILFDDFSSWRQYCQSGKVALFRPVLEYEQEQKGRSEAEIWEHIQKAYQYFKRFPNTYIRWHRCQYCERLSQKIGSYS